MKTIVNRGKNILAIIVTIASGTPRCGSDFLCDDDFDCLPNGTCDSNQLCECEFGFYGDQCEKSCPSSCELENTSTCGTNGKCLCKSGFFGERCENPCPLSCQHGGQCVMEDLHGAMEFNTFHCECPPTHRGGLCEDPISFTCDDDFDCMPYGTCGHNLSCVCKSGHWGEQCEKKCPLKCQNGGQCVMIDEHGGLESENEFYCRCEMGFKGGLCQELKSSATISVGQQPYTSTENETSSTSDTSSRTIAIILGVAGVVILLALATWMIRPGSKINGPEESDAHPAVVKEDCEDVPAPPGLNDLGLPSIT
ncbi:hypothetical protein HJC23_009328 [Cyclotella cryptica]|uniref:EGF-like domain-containing protein n=1 Tax=Cyclotella cryptica TaxID=29204 RepID=A0ABD3QSK4_9STRA|eukprot:CCRYP_002320-RA/>CCRYP_002320-RA protein AED:0.12 eAED:0.12 QI:0/-1/0/1/-1/1/1/0/308